MNLGAPQMLWLLVLLVLPLILFFWWAWRERQRLITQFISARLLAHLKVGVSAARQKARMAMIVAAVALLVLALARPQWGFTQEEARQRGLDVVMVIDTSKSMLAEDVQPNRLARAKLAALDLARRAGTDRLGLVAFAGSAFLECPLTLDDAAFSESVASLDTQTISQGGTAIGEAIDEARAAFKKDSGNHKVIVLFTDGEDHDSDAAAAAEKAAASGIIIFTVGIGTPEGELLRVRDDQGRTDYIRDENGNPVKSHLNEELLQQIAHATKGFYQHLSGTSTMDLLYDRGIAPLPKSENSARMFMRYRERFYWPLSFAIALLIAEMFLPERKRKRPAATAAERAPTATWVQTAALILLLTVPLEAHGGGAASALREYNDGKFQDALKDYDRLLEQKQDDPRLHFNAGAAAYQGQKLDEAVKQFGQAVSSPDLQLQQSAYYNLGNTFYRLGQQLTDTSKKQEAWENALKQYTNALALNKQDSDADFNRAFVEKQLEELKKQQSQSQSQNDKQQQKKDKPDQKQDQKQGQNQQADKDSQQNPQNQQKDSQSQQNQDQSQQKQNSQSQQDQSQQQSQQQKQQDQQQADQSEAQNQPDQQKQEEKKDKAGQEQSAAEAKDKSEEEAKQEAAMMAAGQMTPQQAQQLLDSQKDEEQVLRLAPPNKNTLQNRPVKDW
jgi:Ca-activated chloride channel family protein